MNYKLHIPFVNREDLLREAVESVRDIGHIHIWLDGVETAPDIYGVTFHYLPPLPFTSVMNLMMQASVQMDDVMFFMHNDGLAQNDSAQKFLRYVIEKQLKADRWGVIFTNYDVLCAFNVAALKDVGYWDTMFMQYTSDVDYYHRLASAGWQPDQFACDILHQNEASNTVKADPIFNARTQWREGTGFDKQYYNWKFGGMPGEEKHKAFEGVV